MPVSLTMSACNTPICRNIKKGNVCPFGFKCRYSHRLETLRAIETNLYPLLSKDQSELTDEDVYDIRITFCFVRDTCDSPNDEEATYARRIFSTFRMNEWYPTDVDDVDIADLVGETVFALADAAAAHEQRVVAAFAADDDEVDEIAEYYNEHVNTDADEAADAAIATAAAFAAATECDFC